MLAGALAAFLLSACVSAPYLGQSPDKFPVFDRAITQTEGDITIRASVPTNEEATAIFGIDLSERGIQPVWLEVTNNSPVRTWIALHSIDPEYFPAHEVAYMYKKQFSDEGWKQMEERFHDMSLKRHVPAGETHSGFLFTHEDPGTKTFNVDVFYSGGKHENQHFTFFINVPGFKPDYAEISFEDIYSEDEVIEADVAGLRQWLHGKPCCTTNADGSGQGQPINIVLVAEPLDILQALLRAKWDETEYTRDDSYINSADYAFGRPPDAIFRKSRGQSDDRNEMSIWAAPIRVHGTPVFLVQIKHAIGRRYAIGELFLGLTLDPDVDDGRNYLLQNLWYSQSLKAQAWSKSGKQSSPDDPEIDFRGNPWFSDGFRFVMWISGDSVSLTDVHRYKWDDPHDKVTGDE